jgi:methyltransferase (TIGR00027 family)
MIGEGQCSFVGMMNDEIPSDTALMAAAARAAHLIVDQPPVIFADTLAYELLGDRAEEFVGYHRLHGDHPVLAGARAAVTTRSRYTEDRFAAMTGVDQYVILGAGLDTFAYRAGDKSRVFEVDHPATQRWKRRLLADAGTAIPDAVTYVPLDLEKGVDGLLGAGLDHGRPALVSWLGVTMYLTREAIGATLAVIGGFAPGTEIVLDYMLDPELRDAAGQAYAEAVAPVAAERGEPWLSTFGPREMAALFDEHGFDVAEQVGQRDAVEAALWRRSDVLRPAALSMVARAAVRG